MQIKLEVVVKPENGLPKMFLVGNKDGKMVDIVFDAEMTLAELFQRFEAVATESPKRINENPIASKAAEVRERLIQEEIEEPAEKTQVDTGGHETEIQREDLIRIKNLLPRFKDAGGNELVESGLLNGSIYRVIKVNQVMVTLPDNPEELTRIVQSYEVINDKAPRPERLLAFPEEVELHKKRTKSFSKQTVAISDFLHCAACGDMNALILDGNVFKGTCQKCGLENEIERLIVDCPTQKCTNTQGDHSKVSIYRYQDEYKGACGVCRAAVLQAGKEAMA